MPSWLHTLTGPRPTSRTRKAAFRPELESLEDRRLLSAGALDTTFGSGGRQTIPFPLGGTSVYADSMAVQADGKIVVAGYTRGAAAGEMAVARLNPNGSLDTSFNGGGELLIDFGVPAEANAVAVQRDGKIVVAGTGGDFTVARLNRDGSLDTSFDGDGKQAVDFGGNDCAASVAVQADGKVVVAGSVSGSPQSFGVARLTGDPQTPPPPRAPRAVSATLINQRQGLRMVPMVRVRFSNGATRNLGSPFQAPIYHAFRATLADTNHDGVADHVVLTALHGRTPVRRVLAIA